MKRYGLWGAASRDFLTFGGLVLWHDDRAELEFLVPGTRIRELPPDLPPGGCMPIRQHPDMASISWPLTRGQFQ